MKSHTNRSLRLFALLCLSALTPVVSRAQQAQIDPFIWLEDIDAK